MWEWMHDGGIGVGGMAILMLVFWGLVLAGVVLLVWFLVESARRAGAGPSSSAHDTPLEILKKRYARGEITREQFQEMKRELQE